LKWKGHQGPAFAALWSPNGENLASTGADGVVRIWNGSSFSLMKELSPENEPVDWLLSLVWSPDSQLLIAAGLEKKSRIWDVATGKVQGELQHPASSILSIGWYLSGIGLVAENGWSGFISSPASGTWQELSAIGTPIHIAAWSWH